MCFLIATDICKNAKPMIYHNETVAGVRYLLEAIILPTFFFQKSIKQLVTTSLDECHKSCQTTCFLQHWCFPAVDYVPSLSCS